MRNVMLLGDSHGNTNFVIGALRWASKNEIDCIVQVGDFGFWPKHKSGQGFLKEVGRYSAECGVALYFLDGNHEDHDELDALQARHPFANNFIRVSKRPGAPIFIRRGARWTWGNTTFGAFGGAYSIDKARRTKHVSWFPQEMPDPDKIASLGKVDVLLTHDSPVVPEPLLVSGQFHVIEESQRSQAVVYEALRASQPDVLFQGHWHVSWQGQVDDTIVIGLDADRSSLYASAYVFDTDDRRPYSIAQWEHREHE